MIQSDAQRGLPTCRAFSTAVAVDRICCHFWRDVCCSRKNRSRPHVRGGVIPSAIRAAVGHLFAPYPTAASSPGGKWWKPFLRELPKHRILLASFTTPHLHESGLATLTGTEIDTRYCQSSRVSYLCRPAISLSAILTGGVGVLPSDQATAGKRKMQKALRWPGNNLPKASAWFIP